MTCFFFSFVFFFPKAETDTSRLDGFSIVTAALSVYSAKNETLQASNGSNTRIAFEMVLDFFLIMLLLPQMEQFSPSGLATV